MNLKITNLYIHLYHEPKNKQNLSIHYQEPKNKGNKPKIKHDYFNLYSLP